MNGDPDLYDDDEPHGPKPFETVDLSVLIRDGGPPPPRMICKEMLYPGKVHSLSGPPESGKTTLALWFAAMVLADGGHVAFLDDEGGRDLTASRLAGLGVTEEQAQRLLYYEFPGRSWTDPDIAAWHDVMDDRKPEMMITDSVAVSMGLAGLDENVTKDTVRYFGRLVLPCARKYGAAVLVIDHDAKHDNGSRFAAGSKSKLGTIDVQYKVSAVKPFSRAQSGALRLEVTKDRPGWIHPRIYRVEVTQNLDIWFASHAEALAAEGAAIIEGLPPAAVKILGCLTDKRASGATIGDRVKAAYKVELRRETIARNLALLAERGLAQNVHPGGAGSGDQALWILADYAREAQKNIPPPADGALPMGRDPR